MTRTRAISRSVAGCIARRRRRGEIWPPPQQQPFDALFPPDTGCCAARASAIRSASPGRTIIRSQLVRSPDIRRKPGVQSNRSKRMGRTIRSIFGRGHPALRPQLVPDVAGQQPRGGCVSARPRSHLRATGQNQLCSSCGAPYGVSKKTTSSSRKMNMCLYKPQPHKPQLVLRTCGLALIN